MSDNLQHADISLFQDPIKIAVGNAFYGDVRPFEAKISAIWVAGIFYLEELEKNRSSDIKKAFKELNLPFKDIKSARSEVIKRNISREKIYYSENILIRSYIGIIFSMQKIRIEFYQATNPAIRYPDLFSEVFRDQLIKGFINENIKFINNVISDFFILQLCCQEAGIIHSTRKGVSLDKSKLISRAKVANQAGIEQRFKYGEHVLRKEIEIFIAKKSNEHYKSLDEFYKNNYKQLEAILASYKKIIGHTIESGGPRIEYGEDLEPYDLYEQIIKWKKYPDFKERLESIMLKKTSAR